VNVVSSSSRKMLGHKVVLSGWVGLHDVSSLSSHIEIEDSLGGGDSRGSWEEVEDVRSILEGSSELRSISCQFVSHIILVDDGLSSVSVEDGGVFSILGPVNESSIWSIGILSNIVDGDVVSQSEHAIAVAVLNASLILGNGKRHVERSLSSGYSVSKVVISSPWGLDARWSRDSPCGFFYPVVSSGQTGWFADLGSLSSVSFGYALES